MCCTSIIGCHRGNNRGMCCTERQARAPPGPPVNRTPSAAAILPSLHSSSYFVRSNRDKTRKFSIHQLHCISFDEHTSTFFRNYYSNVKLLIVCSVICLKFDAILNIIHCFRKTSSRWYALFCGVDVQEQQAIVSTTLDHRARSS